MSGAHHNGDGRGILFPLKVGMAFNFLIFIAGAVSWQISGSVAVFGDAMENFIHGSVLVFSFIGLSLAARPPNETKTYGLKRLNAFIPLANAIFLAFTGGILVHWGAQRIIQPYEVIGLFMMGVASADIISNTIQLLLMKKYHENLTIKSIILHLAVDTLASFGVILGGAAVYFLGFYEADGIVAVVIGMLAIIGAIRIGWRTVPALLEGVPKHISLEKVREHILGFPEVKLIHDLHIWSISIDPDYVALTSHVVTRVSDLAKLDKAREEICLSLHDTFHIDHAVIQWEFEECKLEQEI